MNRETLTQSKLFTIAAIACLATAALKGVSALTEHQAIATASSQAEAAEYRADVNDDILFGGISFLAGAGFAGASRVSRRRQL